MVVYLLVGLCLADPFIVVMGICAISCSHGLVDFLQALEAELAQFAVIARFAFLHAITFTLCPAGGK